MLEKMSKLVLDLGKTVSHSIKHKNLLNSQVTITNRNNTDVIIHPSSRSAFDFPSLSNEKKAFKQKKLVGYSSQQMYDVVSDVENYHKFLPFCKKSRVFSRRTNFLKAELVIGFPPLNERYISNVTLREPNLVKAECVDGRLFNYLLNFWKFSPGLKDIPQSCVIDFMVNFEFKSALHSHLANLFFDQIVKQMEHAFINEAENRYGGPSIDSHILITQR